MRYNKHFGEIAAQYKTFRPTYPAALFEYLASIAPARDRAWDCATGNGQAACELAKFFQHIVATDVSAKQIAQAESCAGIEYLVSPAECVPIESGSIDLVTVAQALHWFDLPQFFAEVRRVAKPGGVVACWCYSLLTIDSKIDAVIGNFYTANVGKYWPSERKLVDDGYASIDFPFEEIAPPTFEMTQSWSFDQLLGYLGTWSAVAAYEQANGVDPVSLVVDELRAAWGNAASIRTVTWPLHLRVGKMS